MKKHLLLQFCIIVLTLTVCCITVTTTFADDAPSLINPVTDDSGYWKVVQKAQLESASSAYTNLCGTYDCIIIGHRNAANASPMPDNALFIPSTVTVNGQELKVVAIANDSFFTGWGLKKLTGLEKIYLPWGLHTIGMNVFSNTSGETTVNLTYIQIPASLTMIGRNAFNGWENIHVKFQGPRAKWNDVNKTNNVFYDVVCRDDSTPTPDTPEPPPIPQPNYNFAFINLDHGAGGSYISYGASFYLAKNGIPTEPDSAYMEAYTMDGTVIYQNRFADFTLLDDGNWAIQSGWIINDLIPNTTYQLQFSAILDGRKFQSDRYPVSTTSGSFEFGGPIYDIEWTDSGDEISGFSPIEPEEYAATICMQFRVYCDPEKPFWTEVGVVLTEDGHEVATVPLTPRNWYNETTMLNAMDNIRFRTDKYGAKLKSGHTYRINYYVVVDGVRYYRETTSDQYVFTTVSHTPASPQIFYDPGQCITPKYIFISLYGYNNDNPVRSPDRYKINLYDSQNNLLGVYSKNGLSRKFDHDWYEDKFGSQTAVFQQNSVYSFNLLSSECFGLYEFNPGEQYSFEVFAYWDDLEWSSGIITDYCRTRIIYDANGGECAPGNYSKRHGYAITLSEVCPSREGYDFLGWAKTDTATTAEYQPGEEFTEDGDFTLYAVWRKIAPDFILPADTTTVEDYAFQGCAFYYVRISDETTRLGDGAFADCMNLKHVYLPEKTTSIGSDVFPEGVMIHGKEGSYAEIYADEFGYQFVAEYSDSDD